MLAAMDETTPAIQDYLGAIYDLAGTDKPVIGARLARHMHVSAPSITEALHRMQKDGYIRVGGRKEIRLTTKGLGIAETMARRHRLIERWLTDVLGLDWSRAHDEAHRLEHALSPVVEERLAETLGMPSTCPHGNPIPGSKHRNDTSKHVSLVDAAPGPVTVVRISEKLELDATALGILAEGQLIPGNDANVVTVGPTGVTVKTGSGTHVVPDAVARLMWVTVAGEPRAHPR